MESLSHLLINWVNTFLLITAFMTVVFSRFGNILACYRAQSFALALSMAAMGFAHHEEHLYYLAIATVLIKGILMPYWIDGFLRRINARTEDSVTVSAAVSLFIAGGLLLGSHQLSRATLHVSSGFVDDLTVCLTLLLTGFFFLLTRRHAMSQMLGILFMENGVTAAGVMLTTGMPLMVDLAVLFDVLIGVLVMGILVFRIQETFDSGDTDEMRSLHG